MNRPAAEERILTAAVELFAKCGYSGTSTRDIAHRAKVNEASLYRYFASKRELFTAALARELQPLRAQLDFLRRTANTGKSREAIRQILRRIATIVIQHPELMRLLQFSALEFGAAMKHVYRRHLGEVLGATTKHLQRWSKQEALPRLHSEATVLSFIATVVMASNYYPLFARAPVASAARRLLTEACAEVWYLALSHDQPGQQASITAGPQRTRP